MKLSPGPRWPSTATAAFDIGAIGSRMRNVAGVTLLPMALVRAPEAVVGILSALPLGPVQRAIRPNAYRSVLADYYGLPRGQA